MCLKWLIGTVRGLVRMGRSGFGSNQTELCSYSFNWKLNENQFLEINCIIIFINHLNRLMIVNFPIAVLFLSFYLHSLSPCAFYDMLIWILEIRGGPEIRLFGGHHFEDTIDPQTQIYISQTLLHIYRSVPVISRYMIWLFIKSYGKVWEIGFF